MELAVVIPCYNEEDVIVETSRQLGMLLDRLIEKKKIAKTSKIYFVDDGSKDETWTLISNLVAKSDRFSGIKLSRNCGHQNALLAGLMTAKGDNLVSIDADLQDDVDAIEDMLDKAQDGYDVVYGVRKKREVDTFFKKHTAQAYYGLMNKFGVDLVPNHADFRLMSRSAIEGLRQFGEKNLFLRGIVPLIGYSSTYVYYDRKKRFAGESKYPLKKMISFAWDGITSFSSVPLRFISLIGVITFMFSFIMGGWVLYIRLFTNAAIPGWASSVLPIYFIGGIQIFCLGILGEYLSKVFVEVKSRPRYIIEKVV